MTVKFGKFEKVAGLFVLIAIVGAVASFVIIAVKQGWFSTKVELKTNFSSGDGIHVGTHVQMAGLRAGSVNKVVLEDDNKITVYFEIQEDFFKRVRTDSTAQVMRPFIIGEKVIDVTVGTTSGTLVVAGSSIPSKSSMDIMDLLSGKELGQYLETMRSMAENMRFVAEQLFAPSRSKAMVQLIDELLPTVKNLNKMTVEFVTLSSMLTERKQIGLVLKNANDLMEELNQFIVEMQVIVPALRSIAPDLPRTSRRSVEAIDELVVTLKALQKNFMLRGKVEEVRDEERRGRVPAGEN